jgi:hypothetical protein
MLAKAASPFAAHFWHIVLFVSWTPVFGIIFLFETLRARRSAATEGATDPDASSGPVPSRGATWLQMTAVASISAALVHAAVMPDHFDESAIYGSFFLVTALAQLGFAVVILTRPGRPVLTAGIAGNALVIVLWLASRTYGVPIGPDHGETEPFGLLDALASAYEAAIVVFGILALRAGIRASVWRWSRWAPLARVVGPLCVAATVTASLLGSRS